MTILPLVIRELRVAARRAQTYWSRTGFALLGAAIFTWLCVTQNLFWVANGAVLFTSISGLAFWFCLLNGVGGASDAISEEKREGTLGLLFLANVGGFELILGKLAANAIPAAYSLLAGLPILAMPLLFGGTTPGEFGRTILLLFTTLFFSLSLAMLCSSITRTEGRSRLLFFVCLFLFEAVVPGIERIYFLGGMSSTPAEFCTPSPLRTLNMVDDLSYRAFSATFRGNLLLLHALSWGALLLAGWLANRSYRERPATSAQEKRSRTMTEWSQGKTLERSAYRTRLLDENPYFWRVARGRWQAPLLGGMFVLLLLLLVGIAESNPHEMLDEPVFLLVTFFLHSLIYIVFFWEATRAFHQDHKQGTFELLLCTPLGPAELVRGNRLALQRNFSWPVGVVLLLDLFMMVQGLRADQSGAESVWLGGWLSRVVIMGIDLVAVSWVGPWVALCYRKRYRAFLAVIFRIMVLPAVLYLGLLSLGGLMAVGTPLNFSGFQVMMLWTIVCAVTDLLCALRARKKLESQFRELVTSRFQAASGR